MAIEVFEPAPWWESEFHGFLEPGVGKAEEKTRWVERRVLVKRRETHSNPFGVGKLANLFLSIFRLPISVKN